MIDIKDKSPEEKERILAWIYADEVGIVNNDTLTYSRDFYELLCIMIPRLDPKLASRERVEIVIMEYLRLHHMKVPDTASIRSLSLAAKMASDTLSQELGKGRKIDDILDSDELNEDDGINE